MSQRDLLLGKSIKGYLVVELLGEGGMGCVYRAEHPVIGKSIAVKMLHPHLAQDPETLARFLQEAKATNQIQHDNIVDILDYEQTPDGYFLLMEYLSGRSLEEVLQKDAPLPLPRVGKIALQLCAALHAAHQKGIIHRDLKAENIFLITHAGRTDFVKILDFGVAKFLRVSTSSPKTQIGSFIGSPICIAPEQALGYEVDGRADIYALGTLLYQMATGSRPFRGDDPLIMLSQHLAEPAPPLTSKKSDVPLDFEAVVLRCLEKDKEKRFSSMKELARALAPTCQVELSPYFLAEDAKDTASAAHPVLPNSTRRTFGLSSAHPMLTPLANPPLLRKATGDELPTTEVASSPKLAIPEQTKRVSALPEDHDEEWMLSPGDETRAYDTLQQKPVEEEPASLEELRSQETVSISKADEEERPTVEGKLPSQRENVILKEKDPLFTSTKEQALTSRLGPAEDIRRQETTRAPALSKLAAEVNILMSGELLPNGEPVPVVPDDSMEELRRQETVSVPIVEPARPELLLPMRATTLPLDEDLMALPSLATLPRKATPLPWWIFVVVGAVVMAALVYLLV